jgi:hypothetical protein
MVFLQATVINERLARILALGALRLLAGFLFAFWVTLWALSLFRHTLGRVPDRPAFLAAAVAAMAVSLGYLIFCAASRRNHGLTIPWPPTVPATTSHLTLGSRAFPGRRWNETTPPDSLPVNPGSVLGGSVLT